MTKRELKDHIKRALGGPMVKVELVDDQLDDVIRRARTVHKKGAASNSSVDTYFTIPLSAGVDYYELPAGTKEVVKVVDYSNQAGGGINELFTLNNFFHQEGMFDFLYDHGATLLSYNIALMFMKEVSKISAPKYLGEYNRYNNTLKLRPTPQKSEFILVQAYLVEGYELDINSFSEYVETLYDDDGFQEYCIALSKIILGYERRKFSNFQSLGDTGISLDGDQLISEGKDEKERLEERLKEEEVWEGYSIELG